MVSLNGQAIHHFHMKLRFTKAETGSVNIGKLTTSTHMGTHIDAPFHFDDNGKKVLDLPIDLYIGRARVIDVTGDESIGRTELEGYRFRWCRTDFIENRKPSGSECISGKIHSICVRISVLY